MKKWLRGFRKLEYFNQQAQQYENETSETSARSDEDIRGIQEMMEHMAEVSSFWCGMRKSPEKRPFCSTRVYVGLAPAHTEPGDIVCLILGSNLPHILRPDLSGRYQLVSEAYVHRIMDGELMAGAVSSTTFKLC